jgi:hypothetical protein
VREANRLIAEAEQEAAEGAATVRGRLRLAECQGCRQLAQ